MIQLGTQRSTPHAAQSEARRTPWGLAAAAFAATVFPMLLYLKRLGITGVLTTSAGDSFYYLNIARRSLRTKFFSFDGVYPTNGFHPVWQNILYFAMRFGVLKPDDIVATLHRLYLGNLFILGVAYALLAVFSATQLRTRWLALPATCPGLLWFVMALVTPVYLSNWSYLNGMESAIELLFLAAALLTVPSASQSAWRLPVAAVLFGFFTLSRLDDVFFLIPILFVLGRLRLGKPLFRTATVVLPFLMIGAYVLYNRMSVGVFLPTSGSIKAGIGLSQSLLFAKTVLFPTSLGWLIMRSADNYSFFPEVTMRVLQVLLPLGICAAFLLQRIRRNWGPGLLDSFGLLDALATGVILKGGYNFVFVRLFHQGFWYYAASIFVANLCLAVWIDSALFSSRPRVAVLASLAYLVLLCYSFNAFAYAHLSNPGSRWAVNVLEHRDAIRDMMLDHGADRFIELNDGEITYVTGLSAMSGQGLALDPVATRALIAGHLFQVASDRGYHFLVAGGPYRTEVDNYLAARAHGDPGPLYFIHSDEFRQFHVEGVAYDQADDVRLYRITPAP